MAQNDQSFLDSVSKNEFFASGLYPETMKHIFQESCQLKIAKLQDLPWLMFLHKNLSTS